MKQIIHNAFSLWREFTNNNKNNTNPGLIINPGLAKAFQLVAIEAEIA